jgi:hypothetical protein
VIIDDQDNGLSTSYPNNFIKTSPWWGLMSHYVKQAIQILSKEAKFNP